MSQMENNFDIMLRGLPEGGAKGRITAALWTSGITDEAELRAIVAGKTNAEVTSLLQRNLGLNELDASALAGILVSQSGKVILLLACTI